MSTDRSDRTLQAALKYVSRADVGITVDLEIMARVYETTPRRIRRYARRVRAIERMGIALGHLPATAQAAVWTANQLPSEQEQTVYRLARVATVCGRMGDGDGFLVVLVKLERVAGISEKEAA